VSHYSSRHRRRSALIVGPLSLFLPATTAFAADAATLDKVVVTASKPPSVLDLSAQTGSRLGLTARETPAALEVLTQEDLLARGVRTTIEALNAAPGVTAANLGSAPGSTSMRGFTGGAVSLLFDGMRQTAGPLITRNLDAWSFERIEVLKGPASVLYGEGALAGAINLVPKTPQLGQTTASFLLSTGSLDHRLGLDGNVALSDIAALRTVVSHSQHDGYIDDTQGETTAATVALALRPSETLRADFAFDHFGDDFATPYWGTPLVPAATARDPSDLVRTSNGYVLDKAMRDINYNVADGRSHSSANWVRSKVEWRISDRARFSNELSYYDAKRRWANAEDYTFAAGLITRDTSWIEHKHSYWVERTTLSFDADIGAHRNRLAVGTEYSVNDFFNIRRFGTTSSVDVFAPQRGAFPVDDTQANFGSRNNFDSRTQVAAAFLEDAFNLTPRWLLVGGARYDRIELERSIFNLNAAPATQPTRFARDYSVLSWRLGSVFDLAPKTQLYAQYSDAVAPVGSLLLLSAANARFDLTKGKAVDVGIKSTFWNDRIDLTASAYQIKQDDILSRQGNVTVQGGRQSSRGVELAVAARVNDALRIEGSIAALDAKFDELRDAGGDRAGNTPPNVPERVATLFAHYRLGGTPLTFSGGMRHAGAFYTDNANTIRVDKHTILDAAIGYRLPLGELTLRGRNLTDALYADRSSDYSDQIILGAPRSWELEWRVAL